MQSSGTLLSYRGHFQKVAERELRDKQDSPAQLLSGASHGYSHTMFASRNDFIALWVPAIAASSRKIVFSLWSLATPLYRSELALSSQFSVISNSDRCC